MKVFVYFQRVRHISKRALTERRTLVTVVACFLNLPTDIMKLKTLKGLALQDILTEVHLYVHRGQFILPEMTPLSLLSLDSGN